MIKQTTKMKKTTVSNQSKPRANRPTVLAGTEEIVNNWMAFEKEGRRYRHKSACQELARREKCGAVGALIEELYNKIDDNWIKWRRDVPPSKKNWQLRRAKDLAKHNQSKEKQLEKNIAKLLGKDWFNQIPTASGLTSSSALKKASIDLVFRIRPHCYELIELKCESNNPLFAAIEILLYGLLYIHAREHQEAMKYPLSDDSLLIADEISLHVLAPKAYYCDYKLSWFEKTLSDGIEKFAGSKLKMDFKFKAFSAGLWDKGCDKKTLQQALDNVTSAFLH